MTASAWFLSRSWSMLRSRLRSLSSMNLSTLDGMSMPDRGSSALITTSALNSSISFSVSAIVML